ncbi:MAG: hypothetical protein ABIL16_00060 [candidate division WOR-3 bacterium]
MKWFAGILLSSLVWITLSILTVMDILSFKSATDLKLKVMNLRENLSYVGMYYALKNDVLMQSHLHTCKNLSLEIGDSSLVSYTDSLATLLISKKSSPSDVERYISKIKDLTGKMVLKGERGLNLIFPASSVLFFVISVIFSLFGIIEIRNNLAKMERFILDLRLGIVWEKVELYGDFGRVGSLLNNLIRDIRRVRTNAQKIARS